jgi:cytosine/adenosine deaminase-related metal-dependent hydrolase
MTETTLFADHAYLPDGWRRNVLLRWDATGTLTGVRADTDAPAGAARAAGPVLPGMPNLHSHAFQRAMAGLTEYRANPADSFWSWRDLMYRFALKITPDALAAIARWLYVEMLKCGYTSVCEFHYVHHAQDGSRYPQIAELGTRVIDAARAAGIGITMLPVSYQFAGFGNKPPRDDQRRFINTPDGLLELLDTMRRVAPEHGGLRYGVAPHSLRAVSENGLRALLDGVPDDAPVHIHIAEQTAEVDDCVRAYGARPVQWLLDRFDVDARWCVVHATHVDAAETAALAKRRAAAGCASLPRRISATACSRPSTISRRAACSASAPTVTHRSTGARSCACSNTDSGSCIARATCSPATRSRAWPTGCSTRRSRAARRRAGGASVRCAKAAAPTGSCSIPRIRRSPNTTAAHGCRARCSPSMATRRCSTCMPAASES